jgi:SP family general alpha glucoside:H+ symporter-like MFS transporter
MPLRCTSMPFPLAVTVILSCSGLAAVFIDAILVEKIGRRRMTLFGFSGACTGILTMGIAGMFDYSQPKLAAVLVSHQVQVFRSA